MGSDEIADHNDYLLKKAIFRIGEVASVDGREVSVRVDQEKNRSHILYKGDLLSNVSVGGYVKFVKGFNRLIGKIEKEYVKEVALPPNYTQPAERFVPYPISQDAWLFFGGYVSQGH